MKDIIAKLTAIENGKKKLTENSQWERDTRGLDEPPAPIGEAGGPPPAKVYPDTKEGVLQYMQYGYDKSFLKRLDLPTCKIHADPSVEGVWAVDSMASGFRCIIYLAGYNDPWGQKRTMNDNEEGGFKMSTMKSMVERGDLTPKMMKHWVKCGSLEPQDMDKLMEWHSVNFGESVEEATLNGPTQKYNDPDEDYDDDSEGNGGCPECGTPFNPSWTYCHHCGDGAPDQDLDEAGGGQRWKVTYWVEEKSYDDRPGREYEDSDIVTAPDADAAYRIVKDRPKQTGRMRYDFKVTPAGPSDDLDESNGDNDDEIVASTTIPTIDESDDWKEPVSPVVSAITNRIMRQRLDLLQKYGPEAVTNAIDEVAEFVGDDLEEIGTSDVSIWVKSVERALTSGVTEGAYGDDGADWEPPWEKEEPQERDPDRDYDEMRQREIDDEVDESIVGAGLMAAGIGAAVQGDHMSNAQNSRYNMNQAAKYSQAPNGGKMPQLQVPRAKTSSGYNSTAKTTVDKYGGISQCAGNCSEGEELTEDPLLGTAMQQAKIGPKMLVWYRNGEDNTIFYGDSPVASNVPPEQAKAKFDFIKMKLATRYAALQDSKINKGKKVIEGAKVDRMVGHIKSSEKKLGKSSKDAENIAWATANKRGMLDNKNKKKTTEGQVDEVFDTPQGQAVRKSYQKKAGEAIRKAQLAGDYDTVAKRAVGVARSYQPPQKQQQSAFQTSEGKTTMRNKLREGMEHLDNVSDPQLKEVLRHFGKEVRDFAAGKDLDDHLYNALYDFYFDEMPYGTKKARTGDPYNWVSDRLDRDLGNHNVPSNPMGVGEGAAGDIMPTESIDSLPDDEWYDSEGALSSDGAYDAGGHYDAERDAGKAEYNRDTMDEDSFDPTQDKDPGDEVLVELNGKDEELITEKLAEVGLDHGLDFWFEGNEIVVIGSREARVVTSTVGGHIQSHDGEEFRIGATPRPKKGGTPDDMADLLNVPDLIGDSLGGMMGEGKMSELDIERKEKREKASKEAREKKAKEEKAKKAKEKLKEDVDAEDIELLTMQYKSGQLTYDQFREKLDSMDQTDYSMRQGEMGMYDGDTAAGHRHDAFNAENGMDDDFGDDPEEDDFADGASNESVDNDEIVNRPAPKQLPGYGTAAGDKDRQGRRQPMTAPGNNPMAEARKLMSQYSAMLNGIVKK